MWSCLNRFISRFEWGASKSLQVRVETLAGENFTRIRILYISDLHLHRWNARKILLQTLKATRNLAPTVILLGGDLVDNKNGIPFLRQLVVSLQRLCTVAAVSGNHERYIGTQQVRDSLVELGVHWLEELPLIFTNANKQYFIAGNVHSDESISFSGTKILCAHHPKVFKSAIVKDYSLVLAGHLHGGQGIFFEWRGRYWPGALASLWTGAKFVRGNTTMLVSRGVNDTVPLRFNCPREVILCLM